jgi:hypothetical protein
MYIDILLKNNVVQENLLFNEESKDNDRVIDINLEVIKVVMNEVNLNNF